MVCSVKKMRSSWPTSSSWVTLGLVKVPGFIVISWLWTMPLSTTPVYPMLPRVQKVWWRVQSWSQSHQGYFERGGGYSVLPQPGLHRQFWFESPEKKREIEECVEFWLQLLFLYRTSWLRHNILLYLKEQFHLWIKLVYFFNFQVLHHVKFQIYFVVVRTNFFWWLWSWFCGEINVGTFNFTDTEWARLGSEAGARMWPLGAASNIGQRR